MKKQTKKLTLNKKTISNLNEMEMSKKIGGSYFGPGGGCGSWVCGGGKTNNGNSCPGHNTCYNC